MVHASHASLQVLPAAFGEAGFSSLDVNVHTFCCWSQLY